MIFQNFRIVFKDITTLLNKEAFKLWWTILEDRYKSYNLDYIAGIDSRGFIFWAALADRLEWVLYLWKKGKLPSLQLCVKNMS